MTVFGYEKSWRPLFFAGWGGIERSIYVIESLKWSLLIVLLPYAIKQGQSFSVCENVKYCTNPSWIVVPKAVGAWRADLGLSVWEQAAFYAMVMKWNSLEHLDSS